jgi:ABC-type Zn2+ transport system substrate-binding protein/surface adhesin
LVLEDITEVQEMLKRSQQRDEDDEEEQDQEQEEQEEEQEETDESSHHSSDALDPAALDEAAFEALQAIAQQRRRGAPRWHIQTETPLSDSRS